MPHGWAIAEIWLLMRDCLAYEQDDQFVLLAGVSPNWFEDHQGIIVKNLPTCFGKLDLRWKKTAEGAILELGNHVQPPGGFVLPLPSSLNIRPFIAGTPAKTDATGSYLLPRGTDTVHLELR